MKGRVIHIFNSSMLNPSGGGRTRVVSEAKYCGKQGYKVRVICFVPLFTLHAGLWNAIETRRKMAEEARCQVTLIPSLPFRRFAFMERANSWICGAIIAMLSRMSGTGIIHGQMISGTMIALRAKRFRRSLKVVTDVHGVESEEILYESGPEARNSTLIRLLERREKEVLTSSDRRIFVSRAMQEHFERKYQTVFPGCEIVPCATETDWRYSDDQREYMRREHGLSGKLVFVYNGNASRYQLIDTMCELFVRIRERHPEAYFLILSSYRTAFRQAMGKAGIDTASGQILSVQHDVVADYLIMGDIGFLLRDRSVVNKVASPTKFAEYCLSGVPVLAGYEIGDISGVIESRNVGALVDVERKILSADVERFLCDVTRDRDAFRDRCIATALDLFSWDAFGPVITDTYSTLLQGTRSSIT
jgi:hypothetical protein